MEGLQKHPKGAQPAPRARGPSESPFLSGCPGMTGGSLVTCAVVSRGGASTFLPARRLPSLDVLNATSRPRRQPRAQVHCGALVLGAGHVGVLCFPGFLQKGIWGTDSDMTDGFARSALPGRDSPSEPPAPYLAYRGPAKPSEKGRYTDHRSCCTCVNNRARSNAINYLYCDHLW